MSLENVILNRSEKVESALDTLRANRQYRQAKRTHGLERINVYVEDVEGRWLEDWSEADEAADVS